jgi:hypothetical protein
MKKLFLILAAAMMTVSMMAQEQAEAAVKGAQLVRSGNKYYYGSQEVMNKNQMLDWYARHNCQAAYDKFAEGRKIAIAGWTFLGVGLAMDAGSIVSCAMLLYGSREINRMSAAYKATVGLSLGACALEIACIPTLIVGYHKMHHSVDIYNVSCSTARVRPYWTLQASSDGLGLAMKF